MSGENLTDLLADRVMGWRVCPDRFIKSGRSWIPKWRFKPLTRLEDAFLLLDRASDDYTLACAGRTFTAEVRVGRRVGRISGEPKANAITLAVAKAIGLELPW